MRGQSKKILARIHYVLPTGAETQAAYDDSRFNTLVDAFSDVFASTLFEYLESDNAAKL